jgi:hypothetical protein
MFTDMKIVLMNLLNQKSMKIMLGSIISKAGTMNELMRRECIFYDMRIL